MGKTLVIVESPAKAKTIERYLGKGYTVAASVGHIRDLPASTIGVDVAHDFKPRYITMPGKEMVIRELQQKAGKADQILLATDPDREGEAIAWHLATVLKLDPHSPCRVTFNEITKSAVSQAIREPRAIDLDLVNAQQTRRILDRLVGYELSPLLWRKVMKGLSAGRVQSLATRMIVVREREIAAFKPEEYWLLDGDFLTSRKERLRARYHGRLVSGRLKTVKLHSGEAVETLQKKLRDLHYQVGEVKKKQSPRASYPPFTTSSLQQEASRVYNFSATRTMRIAQQLYEGVPLSSLGQTSLISYMRTDSLRISEEALQAVRPYIRDHYGQEYLSEKPRVFRSRGNAQDAHEAIRPIHFDLPPQDVQNDLSSDQLKLYRLIWNRFVSSQMSAAIFDTMQLRILGNGEEVFQARGEQMVFPGWMKVYERPGEEKKTEEEENLELAALPTLESGEDLKLQDLKASQKWTQPPARYTEASLIKAMEEEGVGRPSTYAPTIATILQRKYVEKEQRSLLPTPLGTTVTELLEEHFQDIVDTGFTAAMEKHLDEVEAGERSGVAVLSDFYPPFHAEIEEANQAIQKKVIADEPTGRTCPSCGQGELFIKMGRYGKFIACSRYPDCHYTEAIEEKAPGKCPLCGSGLLVKKSRKGHRTFYVCDKKGSDPQCPFISWDLPLEERCELCGSYLVEKHFRGRSYKRCSNPDCPNSKSKKAGTTSAKSHD